MNKVVDLAAHRSRITDEFPPEPRALEVLSQNIIDPYTIELVINDYGTLKVMHLKRGTHSPFLWDASVKTMAEAIEEALRED